MAQLASASGLGPEGPVFESQYPDIMTDNPGRISEKEAASIFAISCNSFEIKDYTIVEQIAESIREEYGDIVEYR